LFAAQLHATPLIVHESSPHTAAETALLCTPRSAASDSFALSAWTTRRVFDFGAQITSHDSEQSTGIEHELLTVNSTLSSSLSTWSKVVQAAIDRFEAVAEETKMPSARAHVAHRATVVERITQASSKTRLRAAR
jgi:hypothetical protein